MFYGALSTNWYRDFEAGGYDKKIESKIKKLTIIDFIDDDISPNAEMNQIILSKIFGNIDPRTSVDEAYIENYDGLNSNAEIKFSKIKTLVITDKIMLRPLIPQHKIMDWIIVEGEYANIGTKRKTKIVLAIYDKARYILYLAYPKYAQLAGEILISLLDKIEFDVEKWQKEQEKKAYDNIIKALSKKASESQVQVALYKNRIDALEKLLIELRSNERTASILNDALKNGLENESKKVIDDLKQIKELKKVEKITFENGSIAVNTAPLAIKIKDTIIELGKYKILLNVLDGNILAFNENMDIGEKHHPHVQSGGNCCFGNMAFIRDFLKNFEYKAAVTLMIDYLESYNPESAYIKIEEFVKILEARKGTSSTDANKKIQTILDAYNITRG